MLNKNLIALILIGSLAACGGSSDGGSPAPTEPTNPSPTDPEPTDPEPTEPEPVTGQSVAITDTSTTTAGKLRLELDNALSNGKLSVNVKYPATETEIAYLTLFGSSTSAESAMAELQMDSGFSNTNGNVGIKLRSTDAWVADYTAGEWTNISVAWDNTVTNQFTVAINGAEIGTYSMNNNVDIETIDFKFTTQAKTSEQTFYVDDLIVYGDTSGTDILFSDDFGNIEVGTDLSGYGSYSSSSYSAVISDKDSSTVEEVEKPDFTKILPSETGIELQDWYLSVPTNNQGKTNDKNDDGIESPTADSISIAELVSGYTDEDFFYGIIDADGDKGIVMKSPSRGPTTSENTYYARVELRELLTRSDSASNSSSANNWVFSSAPSAAQNAAGGVDGELNVTLAVNHVTTTYGEELSQVKPADQSKSKEDFDYQLGRVVIGQIHASSDEPIRLYYRKLPSHTKGSVYFYHEPAIDDTDEILVELIGNKNLDNDDSEPEDGIALDEKFSYKITVVANELSVTISRNGKSDVTKTLDMTASGFDDEDEWHYFKVGLYHLNNTAADDDYVQATFYEIRNSHDGYSASE